MIFKDFAIKMLGSKSKVKVALYFLSGHGPSGEREIARAVGLSHVAVSTVLADMKSVNFLRKSRIGNVNVWSLNENSYAYKHANDLQSLAKDPPLLHLKRDLESDLGKDSRIKKLVLFGSIAEGTEKENSDIDIFIMVDNEENRKGVLVKVANISERYNELYGNKISPFVLTQRENKSKSLMNNIERGIVIK